MRSILTRSAVAIATLAIGSAAVAASPATAATASGVTRDMVLTAANGARAADAGETEGYSDATTKAVRSILNRACSIDTDGGEFVNGFDIYPTAPGGSADGVLLTGFISNNMTWNGRPCVVGAIATTDASFNLAGTVSLDGDTYDNSTFRKQSIQNLSGDVYVTQPLAIPENGGYDEAAFAATGNAVKDTSTTTTKSVPDTKTAFEIEKAKAKYDSRIAKAKKSYAKALDKAGDSKSKKSAAKKKYQAARNKAKAQLAYATGGVKNIEQTTVKTEARPFYVSASTGSNWNCGESSGSEVSAAGC